MFAFTDAYPKPLALSAPPINGHSPQTQANYVYFSLSQPSCVAAASIDFLQCWIRQRLVITTAADSDLPEFHFGRHDAESDM